MQTLNNFFFLLQKYYVTELQVLGLSPKEWVLYMMQEEAQLDTLALMAIRNMLDVSISHNFNLYFA